MGHTRFMRFTHSRIKSRSAGCIVRGLFEIHDYSMTELDLSPNLQDPASVRHPRRAAESAGGDPAPGHGGQAASGQQPEAERAAGSQGRVHVSSNCDGNELRDQNVLMTGILK